MLKSLKYIETVSDHSKTTISSNNYKQLQFYKIINSVIGKYHLK